MACRTHSLISIVLLALPVFATAQTAIQPVKSLIEMRQQGVVMQKWDISCGAAALATLLNYQFKDVVSEREIATSMMDRQKYTSNPDLVKAQMGFTLFDLQNYVSQRGYEGSGYQEMTLRQAQQLAPLIVMIDNNGNNHFLVFRGIYKNRVLLADPAWGQRTLTIAQFKKIWKPQPQVGRIGFQITKKDTTQMSHKWSMRRSDFTTLN